MGKPHYAVIVVIFLTSASKFSIEPNGGSFDVNAKNDRASPNVKTPSLVHLFSRIAPLGQA